MIKAVFLLFVTLFPSLYTSNNTAVSNVDLKKYSGKWYSLYSIPTMFDKGSRQTYVNYSLNNDGYYNVKTVYKKGSDPEWHTYNSKMFRDEDEKGGELEAQFLWPYKVDYWIIELPDDYSYVVVGHPDHKFLFIMSRKPGIDASLYKDIVARCKAKGYDVSKLTSQRH